VPSRRGIGTDRARVRDTTGVPRHTDGYRGPKGIVVSHRALRHPLASHRAPALIQLPGVRSWLRRVPAVPRGRVTVQGGA